VVNNLLNLEIPSFFLTFFFLSGEGKSYLQPDQGFTGCLQLKIRTVEGIDLESVQLETGGGQSTRSEAQIGDCVIRKFARLLLGCLLMFPVAAQRGGAMRGGFGSVRVDSVAARVMEGSSD
jgi:hypothetical protein